MKYLIVQFLYLNVLVYVISLFQQHHDLQKTNKNKTSFSLIFPFFRSETQNEVLEEPDTKSYTYFEKSAQFTHLLQVFFFF